MVANCTVREFDISNGENETAANKIKSLLNSGYSLTYLYSAAGEKSLVVIGTLSTSESSNGSNDSETTENTETPSGSEENTDNPSNDETPSGGE